MPNIRTIRRAIPRGIQSHSAGFTLIELMVVIALLVLIASMTVAAINLNVNNDKVRAGSRQVQSYLAGARDRAIYSKAPRGVRFLLDPTNNRTVSSMVYIAPTDPWTQGTIQLERLDTANNGIADFSEALPDSSNGGAIVVRGFDYDPNYPNATPTDWVNLYNQGLLANGARIRIPADNGVWYTVTNTAQLANASLAGFSGTYFPPRLQLTVAYASAGNTTGASVPAFNQGTGPQTYLLELPPTVLANQDPVLMPKGSVIHLDRCSNNVEQVNAATSATGRGNKLPDSWWRSPSTASPVDPSGFDYRSNMDLMFSPRGIVIGPAAQRGIIHFYVGDQKDADRDRLYWSSPSSYPTVSAPEFGVWADPSSNGYERGDKVILSLFTRTGAVSTHHIYSNSDPFRYAETGEVAGK